MRAGGSYNSSNDTRLHFGLGNAAVMTTVEVRWPSGLVQNFHQLSADAIYAITEGQGIRTIATLPSLPVQ